MTEIEILRRKMRKPLSRGDRATWMYVISLFVLVAPQYSMPFVPQPVNDSSISIMRLHSLQKRETERAQLDLSKWFQKGCTAATLSICVLLGTCNNPHLEASASDPSPAGQRYWSVMSKESTSSVQERITVNEALLD